MIASTSQELILQMCRSYIHCQSIFFIQLNSTTEDFLMFIQDLIIFTFYSVYVASERVVAAKGKICFAASLTETKTALRAMAES